MRIHLLGLSSGRGKNRLGEKLRSLVTKITWSIEDLLRCNQKNKTHPCLLISGRGARVWFSEPFSIGYRSPQLVLTLRAYYDSGFTSWVDFLSMIIFNTSYLRSWLPGELTIIPIKTVPTDIRTQNRKSSANLLTIFMLTGEMLLRIIISIVL